MFGKNRFLAQVESSWDRLYRLAYSWTHDTHLSRDLVQETISRAIVKRKQLKNMEALDAWLFRILSNCWYDVCRQNKYLRELPEMEEPVTNETPETDRYRQEVINKVQRAIIKLPMEQRQIVTLVDLEGFSYSEVADIVNVPIGTVMSRLCRARNKLKIYLDEMDTQNNSNGEPHGDNVRRIR